MNAEDLIALNEEIAGMARAGLPLDQGLKALSREMGSGRLQRVTAALAQDLQAGHTLPEALERQKGRVPPFYAGLVAAGVRSGRVAEVLATLSTYARSLATLRTIVIDALFYPLVVLAFGVVLFGFLAFFVLPQFDKVFAGFNLKLPLLTQWVLELGRRPLELVVAPVAGLVLVVLLVVLGLRRTERGRILWAEWIYAVPVVGTLIRAARLAAFTDLLAIMVDHALPLPEAFGLAGAASSDPVMAGAARQIQEDLNQGQPLGQVLRGHGLVPEWVTWMTGLGERRGTLGPALHQVADMYHRQVELRAALLRSTLPPFLIISLAGAFTFLFIFALMMPMWKLLEALTR